jgi:hypothetical protein
MNLMLNLTRVQAHVLSHLAGYTPEMSQTPGRREATLRRLVNRGLVEVTDNGIQATAWGKDVAGGLRR